DDLFVTEGDESDAAILVYSPYGAVVTNVDADHLDFFGSREAYARVFDSFLERIQPGGFLVCGVDDAGGRRLAGLAASRGLGAITVGEHDSAALRAVGIEPFAGGSRCEVYREGRAAATMTLAVPGPSYVVDALAALATGTELGYPGDDLLRGLATYQGSD